MPTFHPLPDLLRRRALMFVAKFFDGVVPGATDKGLAEAEELGKTVGPKVGGIRGDRQGPEPCNAAWVSWHEVCVHGPRKKRFLPLRSTPSVLGPSRASQCMGSGGRHATSPQHYYGARS